MRIGDYAVKPSSFDGEYCLLEFLEYNDFEENPYFESDESKNYLIVINVIHRDVFLINEYFIPPSNRICEREFFAKIKFTPGNGHKKIFSQDGKTLLYEGYTHKNKPYGLGTAYYSNGNKYREGIFGFKGISQGKGYYSTGQVKFEGNWSITRGYGPNVPDVGNFYNKKGELIFSGKFEIKKGGVGYPMIKYPINYRNENDCSDIDYYDSTDLAV